MPLQIRAGLHVLTWWVRYPDRGHRVATGSVTTAGRLKQAAVGSAAEEGGVGVRGEENAERFRRGEPKVDGKVRDKFRRRYILVTNGARHLEI